MKFVILTGSPKHEGLAHDCVEAAVRGIRENAALYSGLATDCHSNRPTAKRASKVRGRHDIAICAA